MAIDLSKGKSFFPLVLFTTIFLVAIFVLPLTYSVDAGVDDNISGWAWSKNIGWISFNNTTGGGEVNYGANIDGDGNISGYVWTDSIGWIHFDSAGPYPQAPGYSAKVDIYGEIEGCGGKKWVCGWARSCSVFESGCSGSLLPGDVRGGWDGWIFLGPRNASTPGVWLEYVGGKHEFRGYAWGEEVVGWMSFNCKDGGNCAQSSYAVQTSSILNSPPEARLPTSTLRYCDHRLTPQAAIGLTVTLNWEYYDKDGDTQDKYEIHVSEDSNFPSNNRFERVAESEVAGYAFDPTQDASWQNELDWSTTYYWRVRVHDGNFWSDWSDVASFFVARTHASPLVAFSHSPGQVSVGEVVTFDAKDGEVVSRVYDESIPFYEWKFEGGDPAIVTSSSTATTTFEEHGNWSATLKITDGAGYSCSLEKGLEIKVPLPDWREVTPFGRARIMISALIERVFMS